MINLLDILDLRLQVSQMSSNIPDNLISKIVDDTSFDGMEKGADIVYIIERCYHHLKLTKYSEEEVKTWANERVKQLTRLSRFDYTDNEIMILFNYLYYKYCLTAINIDTRNLDPYIQDIQNILSIQVNEKNGIWVAKEELRMTMLQFFSMNVFSDEYINFLESQLTIAKANQEIKQELLEKYLNIVIIN